MPDSVGANFVFVPGAGTDPRVFEATIEALRGFGHEGIAPPLPLDDPAAGPSDHAEAVLAALPEGEGWVNTDHEEAIADLVARLGPMSSWEEAAMAEVFLHDVDPEVARANQRYSGAPGPGMFTEPLPLEAWPEVPTRVLVPREDRLFPLEFQRRVARERLGLDVDEVPGGHLVALSRPVELTDHLLRLARG
jgi:alpha/beta hydrolase family protein